ncbi:MAG: 5-(carboxyamino)imidazole ribonucleotide synthase [Acidimicrobiales bacterium]|nr:5-(carboxyamino)imidazole ribonucleotide synthase [Acidimicrobiales bacterium]
MGIVGGGQLARMTHQAAIALGVEVVVLSEHPDDPAPAAGARHVAGRAHVLDDLLRLAERCDVVTVEHERTPAELLAALEDRGVRVAPRAGAARLGQDKAAARTELARHQIPTAPWVLTDDLDELAAFGERHGWPLVAKAPRGGYDGRGVWAVADRAALAALLLRTGGPLLAEPTIDFRHEVSVIVVRSWTGEVAAYPAVETIQRDHQCHEVLLPARLPLDQQVGARHLAVVAAEATGLVGAMAVELFATRDDLLLNELAVRVHNSGHLTIEACATSQFENHLRAVLGWPLGATDPLVEAASMVNVVGAADGGDPFDGLAAALAVPGAHVHAYGKAARPKRKLGHVTATAPTAAEARATAARAAEALAPRHLAVAR